MQWSIGTANVDEHTQECHQLGEELKVTPLGEELKVTAHGFITEFIPALHKIHEEQCNHSDSVLLLNWFNFWEGYPPISWHGIQAFRKDRVIVSAPSKPSWCWNSWICGYSPFSHISDVNLMLHMVQLHFLNNESKVSLSHTQTS